MGHNNYNNISKEERIAKAKAARSSEQSANPYVSETALNDPQASNPYKEPTSNSSEIQNEIKTKKPFIISKKARVITPLLNVRESPSKDGEIVGHLKRGEDIEIIGVCDGGWCKVESRRLKGNVMAEFLEIVEVKE